MLTENCTDGMINVTRTCIKGLGYQSSNFIIALLIIIGLYLVSSITLHLINERIKKKLNGEGKNERRK